MPEQADQLHGGAVEAGVGAPAQVLLVLTVGETLALTRITLFVTAGGIGMVFLSTLSIGQALGRNAPGAASALLGGLQFLFGALVALARPWEGRGEPTEE
ncbi:MULTISPECIES: hypothetical protein [unclassified Streptomyces]|uniref:hypothetical protein n=1 Tax=unclassified Streptomyces TaxID=2593676 RepID=UPI00403C0DC0